MTAMEKYLKTWIIRVCIFGILALLPIYWIQLSNRTDTSDFNVYYEAATRFHSGAIESIFDWKQAGSTPFRYIPPALLLIEPLARFEFHRARLLWFLTQYLCFVAGLAVLALTVRHIRRDALWMACFAGLF